MTLSIFDLFSIGIGPSSSHTVGPMRAACAFVTQLKTQHHLNQVLRIKIEVFGSLAYTGKGHGTEAAILLGLEGELPDQTNPALIKTRAQDIIQKQQINLLDHIMTYHHLNDYIYNYQDLLPLHTNAMRFTAYADRESEKMITTQIYYSIGGGFILNNDEPIQTTPLTEVPYPFTTAKKLLHLCELHKLSIKELMLANECSLRSEAHVREKLFTIANIMSKCIKAGYQTEGILPGGLNIKRRAPALYQKLSAKAKPNHEHMDSMAWLNLYAIAVNEENAAGGRVVTAPTNGAAGIIPAVLHYYLDFYAQAKPEDAIDFLLTAGAMAILYKKGASISGAEVGCQGEVGVASSMAAAALTAVLGGTLYQIENAAEIAMEHHLGLTCDPIGGLVQIPCIERNAMGAVKAVNAAHLALMGDGTHFVSLDKVIATMKQTGKDMMHIYKETSLGGLAANLPEC